jgi:NTP pyrophosphatase (non-canonical NTP hydrolase)
MATGVRPNTLDTWYRQVNRVYIDRNFYRTPESVFTHLVEVIGGLSSSVVKKQKAGIGSSEYLAKAIGWWLTLCGKVQINSVEAMVWKKFPYACPYCRKAPHLSRECKRMRLEAKEIDWRELNRVASENIKQRPNTMRSWQVMFDDIYLNDDATNQQNIFDHIAQEMGELAEGVRLLPLNPGFFMNEAVDVFAWLMRYANFEDQDHGRGGLGERLEDLLWNEYPGQCRHCQSEICKCAPIPTDSWGRLSRDMPVEGFGGATNFTLFTYEESLQLFKLSGTVLHIGQERIPVSVQVLEEIVVTTRELLQNSKSIPPQLEETLRQLSMVASQQTLTQKTVDEFYNALKEAPTDAKTIVISMLTNLSAGVWVEALIRALR